MSIKSITIDTTGKTTELCKIAMKFNSDKCPYSSQTTSGHRHPYTPVYDTLFSSLKNKKINILEIGIEKNDSINIWRNYFPLAHIYGFEISDEYLSNAKNQKLNNVFYDKIDVKDANNIKQVFQKVDVKYDIIIDDSTHVFEDQIRIIFNSIDYLNENGILIIEDIFRNLKEEDYNIELQSVLKHFSNITFITTEHENRYSPGWDNDKLLILFRNNDLT